MNTLTMLRSEPPINLLISEADYSINKKDQTQLR